MSLQPTKLPEASATSILTSNSGVVFGFGDEKLSHFGFGQPTFGAWFDGIPGFGFSGCDSRTMDPHLHRLTTMLKQKKVQLNMNSQAASKETSLARV